MSENKSQNEILYDQAMSAIRKLWEDQSVGPDQAIDNLSELQGEIEVMIDALQSDMEDDHD